MRKTDLNLLTTANSYYINLVKENPPMSRDEEIDKFTRFKNGDTSVFDYIVNHNIALVISVAKRYINKGLDFDDLIQEGNIGLIKAVEKYDLSYKCKFISYAIYWVRQPILRALSRINRHKFVFIEDLKFILSEYLKFDSDNSVDYLELFVNSLRNTSQYKAVLNIENRDVIDNIDHEKFQAQIREVMAKELNEKEFFIVTKRFLEKEKINLKDLGRLFPDKVSGERVRQIQEGAFEKMKDNPLILQLFEDYCRY